MTAIQEDLSLRAVHAPDERVFSLPTGAENHPVKVVIQSHLADRAGPHYDIRIIPEGTATALSFATRYGFPESHYFGRKWFQQPDHTAEYADFEGRIPKGEYGAGKVTRAWAGAGYVHDKKDGSFLLTLSHSPYTGRFLITPESTEGGKRRPFHVTRLVEPGQHWEERGAYRKAPPEKIWDDPEYVGEEKVDGSSGLLLVSPSGNGIVSARKSDSGGLIPWHDKVPHLRDHKMPEEFQGMSVRGEMALPGFSFSTHSGILNSRPENAVRTQKALGKNLAFFPFELLKLPGGKSVGNMPYSRRRQVLELFVSGAESPDILLPRASMDKRALFDQVVSEGGEGIVLKKINGTLHDPVYKAKKHLEGDFQILEVVPGEGKYEGVGAGALLVGDREGTPVALVGSGITDEQRGDFLRNSSKHVGKLVKVRALEKTESSLRAPVFVGFSTDKREADRFEDI